MVHFIFLIKTSHLKEHHKIGFTIFRSQKQKIWFLQESQKIWIWIKEKEGSGVTLTAGPACQGHLPHSRGDSRRRFLRDGEVSDQTTCTIVTARPLRLDWPPFPHGGATGGARRRSWRLGGGARHYAGAFRLVEHDLGFPTAPEDYVEAS